jgi:hypothetical protein
MSSTGTRLWTLSGTGTESFNQPWDVAVGPNGDIYVSDTIPTWPAGGSPATNDIIDIFGPATS